MSRPRGGAWIEIYKNLINSHVSFWNRLPEPHAKYVVDDLFELRFVGCAVLLNGFIKKTSKLPQGEKNPAIKRRRDFLQNKQQGE